MHKYWGKKPSEHLKKLINKYSSEGDTVLDPFAGYGVFGCEAYILNRNVILNDLNPIANFLNRQLLEKDIDLFALEKQWVQIKAEFEPFVKNWYKWDIEGYSVQLISILRDKKNVPIKGKYRVKGSRKCIEFDIAESSAHKYLEFEKIQDIDDWFPSDDLIPNSRISAKAGMKVSDLFTRRTLSCHAKLLSLIKTYSSGAELKLFKVTFTANLANCSRLVPPIKSRGAMAPGAWMTGFYIGETYLENNVLLYFENRLKKVIKGKIDYLKHFGNGYELNFNQINYNNYYQTIQSDVKALGIQDESIDYIFTDPPYGDAVPYFEQSIIWNSWLGFKPNYEDEIVISDSKERCKNNITFEKEINLAFSEISRVLKSDKYFSLTYHSLSGLEWKAITNACIKNGFELVDYQWLVQKTFTPRQINRLKSIKGDVLVTFKKSSNKDVVVKTDFDISSLFLSHVRSWLEVEPLDINEVIIRIMKVVFAERILIGNIDILKLLTDNFQFTENNKCKLNDEPELYGAR